MVGRAAHVLATLAGVALISWVGESLGPLRVNYTTAGFAYLLLVLAVATAWGFFEALLAAIAATLSFNFFFLPPVGRFTIADPQNWVALLTFLLVALVAGRLSTVARRRALDAAARQRDVERLYAFSRAILLIDHTEPFPRQLAGKLAGIFKLSAVVLYDRRSEKFYRAGPSDLEDLDDPLREAALSGSVFIDAERNRTITAVRLGSEPIAALALQGAQMPDSVLQGIANLIAIGLERAQAQNLASQIEAARQSEKFRTTLLDAMAHELKTPLTSVIAATSALLDNPGPDLQNRVELLRIADEEARRLKELIDDSIEMGRLDSADIRVQAEPANVVDIIHEAVASMRAGIEDRPVQIVSDGEPVPVALDRRLIKLALKQLLDNALKYSPPGSPVTIELCYGKATLSVAVTDHGEGISGQEQKRVFDRLYRSPSVQRQIPGSGLGLSIAQNIAGAHHGHLNVSSRPGETTFRLTLPAGSDGERK